MSTRRTLTPALTDPSLTREDALAHVRAWLHDTHATADALTGLRTETLEAAARLENPTAVVAYIDEFLDMLQRIAGEVAQMADELPKGLLERHVDSLRQIASNAAADQRRCLIFRDRWINRPLPYEDVRPLLTRIVTITRDQLVDYRELTVVAERLAALTPPMPEKGPGLDRRSLFRRFIRPEGPQ